MTTMTQRDFERIYEALRKAHQSIDPNMGGSEFSEAQVKLCPARVVRYKYNDGIMFLEIVKNTMIDVWGGMNDSNPALCNLSREMHTKYPIPQDVVLNDCEIVINTVCGETRTIKMTQEITSVEYMGDILQKNIIGDFIK